MRIRKPLLILLSLTGLLFLTASPAHAHHAFSAEYDATRPIELQGTITRVELTNPHSWITIEVRADDGTAEIWEIEAGAPNGLYRRGFTRDSLPVGTEVTVRGYRSKSGSMRANGGSITVSDGTTTFLGGSNPDSQER